MPRGSSLSGEGDNGVEPAGASVGELGGDDRTGGVRDGERDEAAEAEREELRRRPGIIHNLAACLPDAAGGGAHWLVVVLRSVHTVQQM